MSASSYHYTRMLLKRITRTAARHQMLDHGDRVLMAVSGGPDSVALTHLLAELTPRFSLTLGMAHLNHALRGEESDRDSDFVRRLAAEKNIPLYWERRDIRKYRRERGGSLEEAAREMRHAFLEETAREYGFNKIALGHQADDNAELVLMFLLRGSGPLGISGIPPVRGGRIIRPLLEIARSEIMAYLSAVGAESVTDSSNTDPRYLRNRIRHELLPLLRKEYNPRISETLNRMSGIIREEEEWKDILIQNHLEQCRVFQTERQLGLSAPHLADLHPAASKRVVRAAIREISGSLRRIAAVHIESIAALIPADGSAGEIHLPGQLTAVREGDRLIFTVHDSPLRRKPASQDYEYQIHDFGGIRIPEAGGRLVITETLPPNPDRIRETGPDTAYLDMKAVRFPLTVRNLRPGDRFTPLGMSGSQKVKDFFINRKIPRKKRIRCPLLISGGRILWVGGYRPDHTARVTSETRKVLKAELFLA